MEHGFHLVDGHEDLAVTAYSQGEQNAGKVCHMSTREEHIDQHVYDETVERVQEQIECEIACRISIEYFVFEQEDDLYQRLTEIETQMMEHLLGILTQPACLLKEFDIHDAPQREVEQMAECHENDGRQE